MESATPRPQAMDDAGDSPVVPRRDPAEAKQGLREVFGAEESPLLRYAFGLAGQRETAEDLVQEAFLKLHAHWDEVANPRAWLYRCVRNLALNHIRDHKREIPTDTDDEWQSESPDPDETLGRLEAVGTLRLLVSELDPQDRALVSLKYHEDLKYEQIGERTGLSPGNVGYKLHHVLKGLADSLRRMGVESPLG